MAATSWRNFFKNIGNYFKGEKSQKNKFHWWYKFLINHFCGPTQDKVEQDLRLIYSIEGSKAYDKSEQFKEILNNGQVAHLYSCYKSYKDNQYHNNSFLNDCVKAIVNVEPFFKSEELNIKIYVMEKVVGETLDLKLYNIYKNKPNRQNFTNLVISIKHQNPLFANYHDQLEDYIKKRVAWEKMNPNDHFEWPYISKQTQYFETLKIVSMTASSRRINEKRRSPSISLQQTQPSQTIETKGTNPASIQFNNFLTRPTSSQDNTQILKQPELGAELDKLNNIIFLVRPRFGDVIGWNIIHPVYWLDVLGTIICEIPARIICKLINELAACCDESYKNSWFTNCMKGLLAGPFIAGKLVTFSLAKLFSCSGLQEFCHCMCSNEKDAIEVVQTKPLADSKSSSPNTSYRKIANVTTTAIDSGNSPVKSFITEGVLPTMLLEETNLRIEPGECGSPCSVSSPTDLQAAAISSPSSQRFFNKGKRDFSSALGSEVSSPSQPRKPMMRDDSSYHGLPLTIIISQDSKEGKASTEMALVTKAAGC